MKTVKANNFLIIGLGNPGEEYAETRHNAGRLALAAWQKSGDVAKTTIIIPDEMMNNSGRALKPLIKSKKDLERLIVVHDELDLPLGSFKISFDRGSGGHRGVESVIKTLKTRAFTRVRIGITPTTPSGKLKKPAGEEKIVDFILGKFKPAEMLKLKKVFAQVNEALTSIITTSREAAMNRFN